TARRPVRGKIAHRHQTPAARVASAPKSVDGDRHKPGGMQGMASYYSEPQALASGGRFNPNGLTAAHKTLPFGTRVRVTHLGNGRSVEVKINDRGPYVAGRIIDLSRAAANVIGMTAQGVARVGVEILGKKSSRSFPLPRRDAHASAVFICRRWKPSAFRCRLLTELELRRE